MPRRQRPANNAPDPAALQRVVEDYVSKRPIYDGFRVRLEHLIGDLLVNNHIDFQTIESRIKDPQSLREKITRPGKTSGNPLRDIPDLVGLRVILFYADEVDRVCAILHREFHVDHARSVDRRTLLDDDRIGYLSVHKILRISDTRAELPEWQPYAGLFVEVQVRTLLQHAWAAVSHALQYKRNSDVPSGHLRNLNLLSGLLELADTQFLQIRRAQQEIESSNYARVAIGDLEATIDSVAIRTYLGSSTTVQSLIETALSLGIHQAPAGDATARRSDLVDLCLGRGLKTLRDLDRRLIQTSSQAASLFRSRRDLLTKSGTAWTPSSEDLVVLVLLETSESPRSHR